MSQRSVKVVLEAEVNKYLSNVKKAEQAASDAGAAAEAAGKKIDKAQSDAAKATDQAAESNKKHGTSGKESAKGSDESAEASKKDAEYKAKQRDAAETAGKALLTFGAMTVAGLGAATKAAMDWETAWAGVTKTVDGTPEQMRELESGLRGMAKELPATHTEIAGVAEAAGQLGVARKDVLGFTKTMLDLSVSTNLTADEAATAIAQISNVMGTMQREGSKGVERFGATLVALGNDGASTEKDILSMAQRIAGAGKLVGASESDVLALSNTLASMGIHAELGGGVTTRVLLKMYSAVQGGGKQLEAFANVAGMTAQDFAKAYGTSPVEALDKVTHGLARIKGEGGNVVQTMTSLGMKGTEEMQVMLSLVGAGDLLTDSLQLGNEAWKENTALTDEANKRYETAASKVQVAWNNIKDAAIDAGAAVLPVLVAVAENVSGLAQSFGDLPQPVQQGIVVLTAVLGAAALLGGTLLTVVPKIKDAVGAFKDLNTRSDGSSRGLGKVAKGAGIATAGLTALVGAAQITNAVLGKSEISTAQFTQGLLSIGKGTDALDSLFKDGGLGTQINGIGDAIARMNDLTMFDSFGMWVGDVTGSGSKLNTVRDNLKGVDTSLTGLVAGGKGQEAATAFKAIAKAADDQHVPVSRLVDMFPQYRDKLLEAMNAAGQTNVTQEQLAQAMLAGGVAAETGAAGQEKLAEGMSKVTGIGGGTIVVTKEIQEQLDKLGLAADGTILNIQKFTEALISAGLLTLSARDATAKFEEGLDALDGKIKNVMATQAAHGGVLNETRTDLDLTTEAGRAANDVLQDMTTRGLQAADAMAKNGAAQPEVQNQLNRTYDAAVKTFQGFGMSEQAAIDMTREILHIPTGVSVQSWMSDEAKRMAQQTTGELDKIDGRVVTARSVMIEETHRINYEKRVVESGGNEPDGGGLYGSDRRASGGAIVKRAGGGEVWGPGTSTSDEVPIMASPGEYMLDKGDVQKLGGPRGVDKFRRTLHMGMFDSLAGGGSVGSVASRTVASVSLAKPVVSLEGLAVYVTNPFTGEQVRGIVSAAARHEAAGVVSAADAQSQFRRAGR